VLVVISANRILRGFLVGTGSHFVSLPLSSAGRSENAIEILLYQTFADSIPFKNIGRL